MNSSNYFLIYPSWTHPDPSYPINISFLTNIPYYPILPAYVYVYGYGYDFWTIWTWFLDAARARSIAAGMLIKETTKDDDKNHGEEKQFTPINNSNSQHHSSNGNLPSPITLSSTPGKRSNGPVKHTKSPSQQQSQSLSLANSSVGRKTNKLWVDVTHRNHWFYNAYF